MINKQDYDVVVHLVGLTMPLTAMGEALKIMRGFTFRKRNIKSVVCLEQDESRKLIRLAKSIKFSGGVVTGIPQKFLDRIFELEGEFVSCQVKLGYEHLTMNEVLKTLLPKGVDVPSAFESVGHIAHLNLQQEHEEYKFVIAEVLMDKAPTIDTVVNKVGTIENEFRVLPMEILAGRQDTNVLVKEHSCAFKFDFAKVYWNSKLSTEHQRLVEKFSPNSVVYDAFAGVGPFALPAAVKGCSVFANDLNPESYKYLKANVKLNKVADRVRCYNLDAREFIRNAATGVLERQSSAAATEETASKRVKTVPSHPVHFVMNLPAMAIEFLDAFLGIYQKGMRLPQLHVYCFEAPENAKESIAKRITVAFGGISVDDVTIHLVRDVSPNKRMYEASFILPEAAATAASD